MNYFNQVSAFDYNEYKNTIRTKLKAYFESDNEPIDGICQKIIVYIRPIELDINAKGPKKVN